ncbi:UPF0149 family protein [Bradyrhizobium ontarionense]|uniref:UPF0149 family protein n=1 Tax=Bradyrhizobium ontarionense TaxID=2898149 RepID=A0ABY3RF60_9BRAD|nr:YecA family protein [Bradyrhizobium sp. A19]UFZ05884.1 UPF0149 family protein [Bradyrhizobium sp. A19]
MPEETSHHDELDQALLALDEGAMVLEELDGFIAGLLILPEPVPPGEWFAAAFGLGKRRRSVFASIGHANAVLDLVMAYYDEIARTLTRDPELYQPLYPLDPVNGDVIWELWIEGFAAAVDLRRERFEAYRQVGGDVAAAVAILMQAIDVALEENVESVERANLGRDVPADIRDAVLALYRYRQSGAPVPGSLDFAEQPNPFASFGKIGRNAPCPCGSGQKYKRCCGAN